MNFRPFLIASADKPASPSDLDVIISVSAELLLGLLVSCDIVGAVSRARRSLARIRPLPTASLQPRVLERLYAERSSDGAAERLRPPFVRPSPA